MILNNKINLDTLRWSIIDTILLYTKAGATWFLPSLFVSELTFILLKKIIKNDKFMIIVSTIIFIIPFFIKSQNHYMIVFFRNFTAIGFLAFGYYCYNFITETNINLKYLIIGLLISLFLSLQNGVVDLYSLTYNNIFIYSICSILGSILTIFIFKKINSAKIIKIFSYFGVNSLIVMATQQVILSNFINRITGIEPFNYSYLEGIIILVAIMVIEIPIIEMINRYLPFILGKKRVKTISD